MATKLATAKTLVFPKTIGAAIDLLYTLREMRLKQEKILEQEKSREDALREHIMQNFAVGDLEGAKGKLATASIKESDQAQIVNWEEYLKWASKKDPEAVQKRVGITALREHWDNNEKIPGVERIKVRTLSLNKASK